MRLRLRLPEVNPTEYSVPSTCPHGCGGHYYALHEEIRKRVGDPNYSEVIVRRYKCVTCGHTFRVHPTGVTRHHRSQRLRGIGVMFYVLGISYGGVADALAAFGWQGSKSTVYRDVQAAGAAVTRVRRQQPTRHVEVVSADATYVVCRREAVTVAVAVDALAGDVLEVELVDSESTDGLRDFLQHLQAAYGMTVLISDDQDSYKQLTDELGLDHSVCRTHVNRNVAKLVAELGEQALRSLPPTPPGVESSQTQLLADLEELQLIIALRPPDGAAQLATYYHRYQAAPPPAKGEKATLWYRLRMAILRWSNEWQRLVFNLAWNRNHASQPQAPRLDGTNNVAERAIGWWIKERYRTMRTYKRRASIRNLANLIPYLAARPEQPCLTQLLAA
jgi:transposase-like protein